MEMVKDPWLPGAGGGGRKDESVGALDTGKTEEPPCMIL